MSAYQSPSNSSLAELASAFRSNRDPYPLLARRTEFVDELVRSSIQELLRAKPIAAVAIGGYGRQELFPYSDIDLLIVAATESDLSTLKSPLAKLLSVLWDSGLRVSHSTRTLADCCRFHPENVELHISMLDARFLAGEEVLFGQLAARLPDVYVRNGQAMVLRLVDLARQRHGKYNGTPYHLEPNVKESPGGIRDLHLLRWLRQLQPEEAFLQQSLSDSGSVDAQRYLFALRCFLHLNVGRDANLLTFEMQDEAAQVLPLEPESPEAWMRGYYKQARLIFQRTQRALEFVTYPGEPSFLQSIKDRRGRLSTPEFKVVHGRLNVANVEPLLQNGAELLRLFTFSARHGLPLSWDLQWQIQQAMDAVANTFAKRPPSWSSWDELLSQPQAAVAFGQMQETGVLGAAIPLWHSIDSLVVRDFYHRYTVDEHTLVALGELDALALTKTDKPGRFEMLAREEGISPELRLATLLHDVGKGTTPGEHLRGSLKAARQVMDVMRAPQSTQQRVIFLIEHHLALSTVMNGRDLEDPATARALTSELDTTENLRRLTLLTFADISAVNPTAMSPWRLEQLWRVYTLGVEQLARELTSNRIDDAPRQANNGLPDRLIEFLQGFPKRYLRTHSREQIDHHFRLATVSRREGVAVEITAELGAYLLTVLAHDRTGLFASLCGTLASFGMNIVKGEASSNSSRVVLDLIRFTDPNDTLALNPEELVRLQDKVKAVVGGNADANELLKRRSPARRPTEEAFIVPRVRFNNSASDEATLIDFVGEDRPGLLHDLASAISACGCNIEVVMIDTEAHKAIDVFYVTYQGGKLDEPLQDQLQTALLQAAEI